MYGMTLWTLGIYAAAVLVVVGGQLGLSYLLGERHNERATGETYESGIVSTGSARVRLSAHFYLVAMFFVIFDLEVVFLVAWAVVVTEAGWLGFAEIGVFVVVLIAAWAYLWRIGALDWGPKSRLERARRSTA